MDIERKIQKFTIFLSGISTLFSHISGGSIAEWFIALEKL